MAALLGACAMGSGRVETMSQAPSFRVKTVAVAPAKGTGPIRARLARALVARLNGGGLRAVDLESSDSVVAGSALGVDVASDPRVLAEIRRATEADAVVFLTADPLWASIDVQVISVATGDSVLRAVARPGGPAFTTVDEAAAASAEAVSALAGDRERVKAASSDPMDEIPVP